MTAFDAQRPLAHLPTRPRFSEGLLPLSPQNESLKVSDFN